MIYLSQLLGNPVYDLDGERIGRVSDLGIATGEVFPRVTALAVEGPGRTPLMISWRKYVEAFDEDEISLKVIATDIRFSYLQPNEVLVARDLLNKQIVDMRGMRVVRVNDLKLSDTSSTQLRLLGAEVGVRGILRSISPALERLVCRAAQALGHPIQEKIIAWNYMDLLERDLSNVKLSVSHKTLEDMHPADIADIIERLDPRLRGQVFAQLDDEMAAEAVTELDDDELAAKLVSGMEDAAASRVLSEMDPDDAAELVSELDYERAEKLLSLMGVKDRAAITQLLGYREDTAGRIMTQEFVAVSNTATVGDAIATLRSLEEGFESVRYVYLVDGEKRLTGVVTLLELLTHDKDTPLSTLATTEPVTASPEDDQEQVAKTIAKYNLLALPVVDDDHHILGIVTVDDALEVMQEEHEEDLQIAGSTAGVSPDERGGLLGQMLTNEMWLFFWAVGAIWCCVVAGALTGDYLAGLAVAVALPVALRTADDMARYAINSHLEYDEGDDNAPTLLGFALKGVAVSCVFAIVAVLVMKGVEGIIDAAAQGGNPADGVAQAKLIDSVTDVLLAGFKAAGLTCVVSFLTAPLYLMALRKRDRSGNETSGSVMRALALAVATLVFVALVVCGFAGSVG
ncbi:MAG: CBS domain-containing protein [Atopobiaceae bacterium]|nr:CBS domain-containing protein [Atopobiaceae bacterium]MDO4405103.1 CBS domain-containing protein [Atopobiaceae bacterium]